MNRDRCVQPTTVRQYRLLDPALAHVNSLEKAKDPDAEFGVWITSERNG